MNKLTKAIILLFATVFIVSCKNTNGNEMASNDEAVDSTESFMDFINRFHTDSVFAMSRLCDTIYGCNSSTLRYDSVLDDLVMDTVWNIKEIPDYYPEVNAFRNLDETVEEYDSTATSANEEIYVPESSTFITLRFTKKTQKWYLSEFYFHFL